MADLTRQLDPNVLMEAARAETGLDGFGDDAFVEALTRLTHGAVHEAGLSETGAAGLVANIHRALVNRLRMEADIRTHPEILNEDVSDPIVIMGLPRTGTSKLQRMMSADPGVQPLKLWRMYNIAPLPGTKPGEPDPRLAAAEATFAAMGEAMPEFMAGHPMIPDEVEEEVHILEQTFESLINAHLIGAPSYSKWLMATDQSNVYRYLKRVLQYFQWQVGGRRNRPWVLKSPVHLGRIDTLLRFFPDATLVHTHRDPAVAMASFVPLVEMLRASIGCHGDRGDLAAELLALYSRELSSNLAYRDRAEVPTRIHDVAYDELIKDPLSVIRDIHALRGRVLDPDTETHLVRWDQDNPQHRFGKYSYSLESSRLTREQVHNALGPYIQRFTADQ